MLVDELKVSSSEVAGGKDVLSAVVSAVVDVMSDVVSVVGFSVLVELISVLGSCSEVVISSLVEESSGVDSLVDKSSTVEDSEVSSVDDSVVEKPSVVDTSVVASATSSLVEVTSSVVEGSAVEILVVD